MKSNLTLLPLVLTTLVLASLPPAVAGTLSTSTVNGETIVNWNGKEVFRGAVDAPVQSKSATVDGRELAAITAAGKVIWESTPGAADAIAAAPDPKAPTNPITEDPLSPKKGIKVSTANGQSVVTFEGKEVWKGKTTNKVTAQSKVIDGKTFAAALDGEKIVWENVPGAAKELSLPPTKQPKEKKKSGVV